MITNPKLAEILISPRSGRVSVYHYSFRGPERRVGTRDALTHWIHFSVHSEAGGAGFTTGYGVGAGGGVVDGLSVGFGRSISRSVAPGTRLCCPCHAGASPEPFGIH